jgi:hypothetical protein
VAQWSFNGVAVSGFDLAPRGGEMKGRDQGKKCRRRGSLGAEVALSTMAANRMGGAAASDRSKKTTRVGQCWAERLLWLGPTSGNSKENRDTLPRLLGRIEGMNRKGL